jgi:hypothetical protein
VATAALVVEGPPSANVAGVTPPGSFPFAEALARASHDAVGIPPSDSASCASPSLSLSPDALALRGACYATSASGTSCVEYRGPWTDGAIASVGEQCSRVPLEQQWSPEPCPTLRAFGTCRGAADAAQEAPGATWASVAYFNNRSSTPCEDQMRDALAQCAADHGAFSPPEARGGLRRGVAAQGDATPDDPPRRVVRSLDTASSRLVLRCGLPQVIAG